MTFQNHRLGDIVILIKIETKIEYNQDLRIASICGLFLIIISDIYTTISVFA